MKKSAIAELDRCAEWLLAQGCAVKTVDMEAIAPEGVSDPGSWARRTMRKMEDTGRAQRDDVDKKSGGVWWVHPKLGETMAINGGKFGLFPGPLTNRLMGTTAVGMCDDFLSAAKSFGAYLEQKLRAHRNQRDPAPQLSRKARRALGSRV